MCAGMPFAPVLAQLAKADVNTAVTLLVVLRAGTIIALPIGLPLANAGSIGTRRLVCAHTALNTLVIKHE